jgi:hypothetical protein
VDALHEAKQGGGLSSSQSRQTCSITLFLVTHHCGQRYQLLRPSTVGTAINLAATLSLKSHRQRLSFSRDAHNPVIRLFRPPNLLAAGSVLASLPPYFMPAALSQFVAKGTTMSMLMSMMTKAQIPRSSLQPVTLHGFTLVVAFMLKVCQSLHLKLNLPQFEASSFCIFKFTTRMVKASLSQSPTSTSVRLINSTSDTLLP